MLEKLILVFIIVSIGTVANMEGSNWLIVLAFSIAISIPLISIYLYIINKPVKITIYLFQLVIFSVFYPLTWFFAFLLFPAEFINEVYIQALWAFSLFTVLFVVTYTVSAKIFRLRVQLGKEIGQSMPDIGLMYGMFFLFLATVLFLRWYNGILFHIAINPGYNFGAGSVENIVKILTSLCVVPPILLIVFGKNNSRFGKHAFLMLILFVGVHLPTGLRSATIIPLVAFILIGLFYGRLNFRSTALLSVIMILMVVLQGNLRRSAGDELTNVYDNSVLFVQRMSDLRNTGLMIALIDNTYKPRRFDKLDNFILCYPPNLVRSILGVACNTGESTEFTQEIGVAPSHSSEPITIIGDAFSRFGIFGVAIVGSIFGFLVFFIDRLISKLRVEVAIVYFVVFSQLAFSVYSASLLNMLLIFSRDSIILFVIFYLAARYFSFGLKRVSHRENYR